ncbi:MAG: hypothetical protein H0U59_01660 [Gemmatimonadaceae bacterium]|nr:hypothetical protein [Gemmatimonadaceae bacterium]
MPRPDSLQAELERERELRIAAEQNTRQVLAAMRQVNAGMEAEIAGRVADARAELIPQLRAELESEWPSKPEDAESVRSELREAREELTLYRIFGKAGVKADRLGPMYKSYRGDFDFLDDGRPVVSATASPDVESYVRETLYADIPEWFTPRPAVLSLSRGGAV